MFFNLRELELRKAPFDEEFAVGEIDFDSNFLRQIGPIHATGVGELLSNTLGEVRVSGHVSAHFEVSCDRCLEPIKATVERDFELFYRPAPEEDVPHELEIDDGEAEIGFYEGLGFELKDVLREFILLGMPMQQICTENCQGICPKCGHNRNSGPCNCVDEPVNERWSALREWKSGPAVTEKK